MIIDLQNGTVTKILVREKLVRGNNFVMENCSHAENFGHGTNFFEENWSPAESFGPPR